MSLLIHTSDFYAQNVMVLSTYTSQVAFSSSIFLLLSHYLGNGFLLLFTWSKFGYFTYL